jgi:hypothetical protein
MGTERRNVSFVRVVRHRKGCVFVDVETTMVSFLGSQLHSFLKGGGFFLLSGLCFIFCPDGKLHLRVEIAPSHLELGGASNV